MPKKYTIEELVEIAIKYSREIDFQREDKVAYNQAKQLGFIPELCDHMQSLDEYYKISKRKKI